jgi:hypothetical protein
MHDVLAHRLSLLAAYAGALEFRPDAPPEELARAAGVIRDGAHQALEELREVIGVLRDDPAEPEPDRPAADPVRPAPAARRGPRRRHPGPAGRPPGRRRYGAGRAGPDRLPRRPGRADQRAQARARAGGDRPARRPAGRNLLVVVINRTRDSAEPVRIPGSGSGLVGLRERVQLAGGRLDARSGHGRFRLWAVLPWPA